MKKVTLGLLALALIFAVGKQSVTVQAQQTQYYPATITLAVTDDAGNAVTNPTVGQTLTATITVTNTDEVAHIFGTQSAWTAVETNPSCNIHATLFGTPFQVATYAPGQSRTYITTMLAPGNNCVSNYTDQYKNQYVVYARTQDTQLPGNPYAVPFPGATSNFTVQ